ncbi:MAG: hypothetical protein DIU78_011955 [Pseudomonadota bacterium]|nr:MAG: hypothetical protein DIU78_15760 [Pseudomonadota bacterium]
MPGKIAFGRRLARGFFLAALALSLHPGCAASLESTGLTSSDVAYTRQEQQLFDDAFRAELFGVEQTAVPPEADRLLTKRTSLADAVFPAKVVTLTRQGAPGAESYTLVIRPEGPALAGRNVSEPLSLTIPPENPTFAFLRGVGERWVGTRMILFLRGYTDGLHFHATVDSEPVRRAIERATVLQMLVRPPSQTGPAAAQ